MPGPGAAAHRGKRAVMLAWLLQGACALAAHASACPCPAASSALFGVAAGGAGMSSSVSKLAMRLRGAGADAGARAELYSWKGKLLQAVREEGEVVRLLDLQSSGSVLWERGQSAMALGEILASAQRALRIPAFLEKKVAPYIVESSPATDAGGGGDTRGRGGQVEEESRERSMAAAGLVLPEKSKAVRAAVATQGGQGARPLHHQPQPLPPHEQSKVDQFVQELMPEDMKCDLEALLTELKTLNQQTYGDSLPSMLAAAAAETQDAAGGERPGGRGRWGRGVRGLTLTRYVLLRPLVLCRLYTLLGIF